MSKFTSYCTVPKVSGERARWALTVRAALVEIGRFLSICLSLSFFEKKTLTSWICREPPAGAAACTRYEGKDLRSYVDLFGSNRGLIRWVSNANMAILFEDRRRPSGKKDLVDDVRLGWQRTASNYGRSAIIFDTILYYNYFVVMGIEIIRMLDKWTWRWRIEPR